MNNNLHSNIFQINSILFLIFFCSFSYLSIRGHDNYQIQLISQNTYNNTVSYRMNNKVILFTLLLALATAYTEQDNVLVLTDDDFPSVTSQFSHILIQFYAPWCGHCKRLQPVYKEVAAALKQKGSSLRLAKVDATEHKKAGEEFGVRGYPTLFFFYNGKKIDYNGPRSKEGMLNWLIKKTREPVSEINAEAYAALSSEGTTIVYHGDFSAASGASILSDIAIADDYNNYYWGRDLGRSEGTLEIIRSFGEPVTREGISDDVRAWIDSHERPPVVAFDDRAIGDIFQGGKLGVVLFNGDSNADLLSQFTQAATEHQGESFVFTEVSASNQHLDNFANYIKINRKQNPVVIIQAKSQNKFVLKEEPTKENILSFLKNYKEFKYGLTDEVKAEAAKKEEQEEEL